MKLKYISIFEKLSDNFEKTFRLAGKHGKGATNEVELVVNLMKEISSVVPWYDRRIDMLVVTNPDRDHYEGFIPLLDKYKV